MSVGVTLFFAGSTVQTNSHKVTLLKLTHDKHVSL